MSELDPSRTMRSTMIAVAAGLFLATARMATGSVAGSYARSESTCSLDPAP
jgi:hypothetical protein